MASNRAATSPLAPSSERADKTNDTGTVLPSAPSPSIESLSPFNETPSTSVLCPASAESSLSATIPTASPASPFTTPSPLSTFSTQPQSLSTLHEDILRRILTYLISPAYRGTPYYPPYPPLDLLPLSETSTTFRNSISKHLTTDLLWLSLPSTDIPHSRLRPRLLAWYRFAASNLQVLTLSARLAPPQPTLDDIIITVAQARPSLRTLDLSAFATSQAIHPEIQASVRHILDASRASLTDLHLNLAANDILDIAADANLIALTTLDLRHSNPVDHIRFLALLYSLRRRPGTPPITNTTTPSTQQSMLHTIILRASEPLPPELRPEAVAVAAPHVKNLHYTDLSALRDDCSSLSLGVLALANVYTGLHELVFSDATLDFNLLKPFLERETHRNLARLALNNCNVPGLLTALPDLRAGSGAVIRGLDLASMQIGTRELAIMTKYCPAVEDLGLRLEPGAAAMLPDAIRAMPALRSLTLRTASSGDEDAREKCRADLARAVTLAGEKFAKFVIHGESLSVSGLASIFRALGDRLEFLVTGVHAPGVSMSRAIMALLDVVKTHCKVMKILCFGLALVYDPKAEELNEIFVRKIDELEERLPHLDSIWLRRNAASLLAIPRPADFVKLQEDEIMRLDLDG